MDLTPYIDSLRRSLTAAAAPAGDDAAQTAELLAEALDSGARLALMEALSEAAAEITDDLDKAGSDASVDLKIRGKDVSFTINNVETDVAEVPPTPPSDDDVSRITLRLPESLKEDVEAAAANSGISVNAWLVRAVNGAVHSRGSGPQRGAKHSQRVTGYARA
ncbi:toxin-antitoxin system HicB family antitoxin [Haloglycomyces albus]|uniref:toxin-antitoxin system HicB family antitoxin n=1 Tax=Haloglycomyces albus TaxID=526067 RepID=UPI00046D5385|nr:toxin-antitoxin system HicB family antitoxin [Haloglycomyces albus]